jgi:hypothetical protein
MKRPHPVIASDEDGRPREAPAPRVASLFIVYLRDEVAPFRIQ